MIYINAKDFYIANIAYNEQIRLPRLVRYSET